VCGSVYICGQAVCTRPHRTWYSPETRARGPLRPTPESARGPTMSGETHVFLRHDLSCQRADAGEESDRLRSRAGQTCSRGNKINERRIKSTSPRLSREARWNCGMRGGPKGRTPQP
jgi:hypothetical protein